MEGLWMDGPLHRYPAAAESAVEFDRSGRSQVPAWCVPTHINTICNHGAIKDGRPLNLVSRRQLENLLHLLRPGDRARVARHPGGAHRLFGDAVEMLRADLHLGQAARHAEAADEAVEHVAG